MIFFLLYLFVPFHGQTNRSFFFLSQTLFLQEDTHNSASPLVPTRLGSFSRIFHSMVVPRSWYFFFIFKTRQRRKLPHKKQHCSPQVWHKAIKPYTKQQTQHLLNVLHCCLVLVYSDLTYISWHSVVMEDNQNWTESSQVSTRGKAI